MPAKVKYLQKITLTLETDDASTRNSIPAVLPKFEFVFGLGSSGLTPFEFALAEKTVDDEIRLELHGHQIPSFFGHIRIPPIAAAGESDPLVLKARVLDVVPASSREVVRALAEIAGCNDSCCGHH